MSLDSIADGNVDLRVLVDRSIITSFVNNGSAAVTTRAYTDGEEAHVFAGGEAACEVQGLQAWEMEEVFPPRNGGFPYDGPGEDLLHGPHISAVRAAAKQLAIYVVVPFRMQLAAGESYNGAVIVGRDGELMLSTAGVPYYQKSFPCLGYPMGEVSASAPGGYAAYGGSGGGGKGSCGGGGGGAGCGSGDGGAGSAAGGSSCGD